jgi:hypothetical protein
MCVRLTSEGNSATSSIKDIIYKNPYVIVSFFLGFLTGLYGILTGLDYYYAGWPAHGPVGVVGVFLTIFGFLTILGSFLVFSRRLRIVGAILILFFGLGTNIQGIFNITGVITKLLLPILSFIFALYSGKWDQNSRAR